MSGVRSGPWVPGDEARPRADRHRPDWLRDYRPTDYPPFALAVDLAVFTVRDGALMVLLVRRCEHPYRAWWALPGGHVRHGRESADGAARRELMEETGLAAPDADADPAWHLEQLATYSEPDRDPRMAAGLQVASVAYVALVPDGPEPAAGTDAAEAAWWPSAQIESGRPRLAFDHHRILDDAVERVRAKLEYTTLAARLLTEPFSLAELRRIYQAVWGRAPDPANFRRKVLSTEGFVTAVGTSARAPAADGGRPPELYRRGPARLMMPPLLRRG